MHAANKAYRLAHVCQRSACAVAWSQGAVVFSTRQTTSTEGILADEELSATCQQIAQHMQVVAPLAPKSQMVSHLLNPWSKDDSGHGSSHFFAESPQRPLMSHGGAVTFSFVK